MSSILLFLSETQEVIAPFLTGPMLVIHLVFIFFLSVGVWFTFWPNNEFMRVRAMADNFDHRKVSRLAGLLSLSGAVALLPSYLEKALGKELSVWPWYVPFVAIVILYIILHKTGKLIDRTQGV